MLTTPVRAATAAACRASSTLTPSGFSHSTWTPASISCTANGTWEALGVQMCTASSPAAATSSMLP